MLRLFHCFAEADALLSLSSKSSLMVFIIYRKQIKMAQGTRYKRARMPLDTLEPIDAYIFTLG